jgi:DNA helicase-2/ATP-dependent DNA helicase PcrA
VFPWYEHGVLLNPAQQAAVDHRGGPLLVLAGAGTGKTRVITHRVAALLDEGVPPWRMLAVTFTNKAAAEMRERISAISGDIHDTHKLWVGTFHSICARILRRWGRPVGLSPNFSIYDTSDQLSVMKRVFADLNIGSSSLTPKAVLGYLDRLKNRGMGPSRIDELKLDEPIRSLAYKSMVRYQRLVRAGDAADFGDLLVLAVELLRKAKMDAPRRPAAAKVGRVVARRPRKEAKAKDEEKERAQTALPLSDFAQGLAGMIDFNAPVEPRTDPGDPPLPPLPDMSAVAGPGPGPGPGGSQLGDLVALSVDDDLEAVARLRRRFDHVVVDEFQDTNPVQAELIDLLSTRAELMVVGDDDQAIYGWRGADVTQILNFPDRHVECEVIRLEQNYRSTTKILDGANAIIRRNSGRFGKALRSELGEGEPIRVLMTHDEVDEARLIAGLIAEDLAEGVEPAEIAVFYRTHALSRALEEALVRRHLNYTVYGGLRFFDRKEIKDLLAYLRLMVNPRSDVDLARIINVPARKIGKTSLDRLIARATAEGTSLYEVLEEGEAAAAGLGVAACRRVAGFRRLIDGLRDASLGKELGELAAEILEVTGYRVMLAGDSSEESRDRLENLQEFVGELSVFSEEQPDASLADYLEQVALLSDADGEGDAEGVGAVTLMTIHSAKGLEFRHVYLTGMEERVFPHARVLDDNVQMEEERRLAYVAVTRAKRRLTITWAQARRLYGQAQVGQLSRFVRELPQGAVQNLHSPSAKPVSAPAPLSPSWSGDFGRASRKPAPEPRWDNDIVYDDASAPGGDDDYVDDSGGEGVPIFIGMRVRHRKFGEGEVLGWSGFGDNLKLSLRFATHGTKTILARFCEPV